MPRYQKKRDANELAIVKALRARGVSVYRIESSLDPGVFDLLCEAPCPIVNRMLGDLADIAHGTRDEGLQSWASMRRVQLEALAHHWVLLEVKDMGTNPGGAPFVRARELAPGGKYEDVLNYCRPEVARKLRSDQADFLLRHRAPRAVITTVAEALRACGLEPEPGDG